MFEYDQKIWAAISSVINENANEEERKIFETWVNENEGNKRFFELIVQQADKNYDSSDELKERIYTKIKNSVLPSKKRRRIAFWIPAAAASVLIILSVALFGLLTKSENLQVVFLEATTPYGVKTKLILPDSTVVFLNSGSYLKYPSKFFGQTREISLKGEAYFEVKKDAEHPFIVKTSAISIKVLGTHFNVKTFPDEDLFETTLLEGSVGLYLGSQFKEEAVRLKPNEKASYSEETGKIVLKKAEGELEASWKDNKFYFDNSSLHSIAKDLERNYNVPIRIVSDDLKNEIFSGFFGKNRTIYQTLNIIKLHKNFTYRTTNDTIIIYSKK